MKHFILFSLFAGLVACGQNDAGSDLDAGSKGARLANQYSFSYDHRPVDGPFEQITIKKNEFGSYDANFRVITSGFGFPVTDTTKELGTGLECVETKKGRNLLTLKCSVDLRPADGELTVLTLKRNESGQYDATLRKATYATLQGPATDVTTEIAYGLNYDR